MSGARVLYGGWGAVCARGSAGVVKGGPHVCEAPLFCPEPRRVNRPAPNHRFCGRGLQA